LRMPTCIVSAKVNALLLTYRLNCDVTAALTRSLIRVAELEREINHFFKYSCCRSLTEKVESSQEILSRMRLAGCFRLFSFIRFVG
jgi:hypothetical protein